MPLRTSNMNMDYVRDCHRGRHSDPGRFFRLDDYAYKRWQKTRDLRHAGQWLKIMEAVKRRSPGWLNARYSVDRPPFQMPDYHGRV